MATEPTAETLRAMASHRGFKLVRSRKRTPGVGDYGKFGLTDATGKALLGIGKDGLTASADEVEDYLRGGIVSSWKLSAETTPDRPPRKRRKAAEPVTEDEGPRKRKQIAPSKKERLPSPARRKQDPPPPPRAKPVLRVVEPDPPPEAELRVRPAKPGDAVALARLLGQLADPPDTASLSRNLGTIAKAKAGIVVADKGGEIAGVCAWAVVPTLQRGLVGRITLLLVDKSERRRGAATALLAAVEPALARAGCDSLEAMSDIMIANAHGFFRARGFEQKSYRFVRQIGT